MKLRFKTYMRIMVAVYVTGFCTVAYVVIHFLIKFW